MLATRILIKILEEFRDHLCNFMVKTSVAKAELLQLNRTQFSSLGIFISKNVGNRKNLDHFYEKIETIEEKF